MYCKLMCAVHGQHFLQDDVHCTRRRRKPGLELFALLACTITVDQMIRDWIQMRVIDDVIPVLGCPVSPPLQLDGTQRMLMVGNIYLSLCPSSSHLGMKGAILMGDPGSTWRCHMSYAQ